MTMPEKPISISLVVAIPTFRRPTTLAAILQALPDRLAELPAGVRAEVMIIDNDPDGSAKETVRAATIPVRYVCEPQPGISAARNRALDEAAGADLLAFVDDDERPLPGWLPALLQTWRVTRPAGVWGRVITVLPDDIDPWLVATGVFRRRSRPTGLSLEVAATNNLLLDLEQVRALGVRFDEAVGLAGGEDSLFTSDLVARGGRIVWCDEANVEDAVAQERLTRGWAMRRAYNGGNIEIHNKLLRAPRITRRAAIRLSAICGGAARAVAGWVWHVFGRATGNLRGDARGLRTAYRGSGMLTAGIGRRHEHYSRARHGGRS